MHTAALFVVGMVVSRGLDGTRGRYQRYRRFHGAAAYKHFKVPPSEESCLPHHGGPQPRRFHFLFHVLKTRPGRVTEFYLNTERSAQVHANAPRVAHNHRSHTSG
jgi:hypothetical protein